VVRKELRWKIDRLGRGESPRALDLFAGCGGLSLGASIAGCEVVGAVEVDPIAARTHALNFHSPSTSKLFPAHARARDITRTSAGELLGEIAPASVAIRREVDVLIGGPPCQAFARVGRAKLREVMEHPAAFLKDPRSGLYSDYLRFVSDLLPLALVIENVPDVLNYGGMNVFQTISEALSDLNYECRYGLLNAAHYGVPQMRTRCFLVGIHRDLDCVPAMPAPSHVHQLPVGYKGSVEVALKHINPLFDKHYVSAPGATRRSDPAVTAKEAIGDLPAITDHLGGKWRKTPQRLNTPIPMASPAHSTFAAKMREWDGFESDGFVYDHAIRFLPRDYKIFARMLPGDQYPQAHSLAIKMRDEAIQSLRRSSGKQVRKDSRTYIEVTKEYVPPYDPGKFPNKWRKMEADHPARTIMAHIGKDSYSHIHYDSEQARTISVREAARLQSFPDGFRFSGTMNPAFRQIGNAVPPLLAHAVISQLLSILEIALAASPSRHRNRSLVRG
jgi:DNA (cytosine-5)-methyltransferase 1